MGLAKPAMVAVLKPVQKRWLTTTTTTTRSPEAVLEVSDGASDKRRRVQRGNGEPGWMGKLMMMGGCPVMVSDVQGKKKREQVTVRVQAMARTG